VSLLAYLAFFIETEAVIITAFISFFSHENRNQIIEHVRGFVVSTVIRPRILLGKVLS
jgi:hypothetical protein